MRGRRLGTLIFFRSLKGMAAYDEDFLRTEFPAKNFSELKYRLEKRIMRALVFFRDTPTAAIDRERVEIEILIEKGLMARAWKKLATAKKNATAIEAFAILLRLLELENTLLIKSPGKRDIKIHAESLHQEHLEVLEKNTNQLEYQILFNRYYVQIKSSFTPLGALETSLSAKIKREPLLSSARKAKSAPARIYYYRLRYFAEYLIGNFDAGQELMAKLVATYEANQHLIQDQEDQYIFRVFDLMILEFRKGQLKRGYKRLMVFEPKRDKDRLHFEYYYTGLFEYALATNDTDLALDQIKGFEQGLAKFSQTPWKVNGNPLILYLWVCRMYYQQYKYAEAARWNKRILDEQVRGQRIDIIGQAKLIHAILHYELGNPDLTESSIKSAALFLNKRKSLFEFERLLLNLCRFLLRNDDPDDMLQKLQETKRKVELALQKDSGIRTFHFFDYLGWINRKIESLQNR